MSRSVVLIFMIIFVVIQSITCIENNVKQNVDKINEVITSLIVSIIMTVTEAYNLFLLYCAMKRLFIFSLTYIAFWYSGKTQD